MAEVDPAAAIVTGGDADNHEDANKDNQQGSSDWTKGFDEGLKKRLEKFKTPSDLAKSYVELETLQSKAFQDITDSEKEKYIKRLGLPESPEGYELSKVTLPDGLQQPKEADAEFKAFVHSLKLTKDQAKGLHEWAMTRATKGYSQAKATQEQSLKAAEESLKTAWGAAFDANMAATNRVIQLGGDEFVAEMNSGPGKSAKIRLGLLAISKQFADETLVSGRADRKTAQGQDRPGMVFPTSKSPELAVSTQLRTG